MNSLFKLLVLISIISIPVISCKKITTPNEESKALFGAWRYQSSSGGFSGGGSANFDSDYWIEFTETGIYKTYQGKKKTSKARFEIQIKTSSLNNELKTMFVFENGYSQSFEVKDDILYIDDEHVDGFGYRYCRK